MKNQLWSATLLILTIGFGSSVFAQKGSFSTNATVGVTTPILDNGIGVHLGINPSYALFSHLSVEGQLSFIHTNVNGAFISGNEEKVNAGNALVGGRLYFTAPEKNLRPYLNLLLGGNYTRQKRDGGEITANFGPGISIGGFLEMRKLLVGLSFDTPQNIVLKAGFSF